jgi:hypothetical protein
MPLSQKPAPPLFTGRGSHEGDPTVHNLEGVLLITHALRMGLDHMNPRLG